MDSAATVFCVMVWWILHRPATINFIYYIGLKFLFEISPCAICFKKCCLEAVPYAPTPLYYICIDLTCIMACFFLTADSPRIFRMPFRKERWRSWMVPSWQNGVLLSVPHFCDHLSLFCPVAYYHIFCFLCRHGYHFILCEGRKNWSWGMLQAAKHLTSELCVFCVCHNKRWTYVFYVWLYSHAPKRANKTNVIGVSNLWWY